VTESKTGEKCNSDGAAKIRRRRDWSVDDFDAVEIRRSSSTKFDGATVYIKVVYRMVRGAADLIINSQSLLNW